MFASFGALGVYFKADKGLKYTNGVLDVDFALSDIWEVLCPHALLNAVCKNSIISRMMSPRTCLRQGSGGDEIRNPNPELLSSGLP